jgi:hypothetical protein
VANSPRLKVFIDVVEYVVAVAASKTYAQELVSVLPDMLPRQVQIMGLEFGADRLKTEMIEMGNVA